MGLLLSRRPKAKFAWRPEKFEAGTSITLPAPFGGLNLRDDITALKPNEARILNNWFPTEGLLSVRPGNQFHAGGMGTGEVKTLAAFVGYSASALLAAADGRIFLVTDGTYEDGNDSYTKVYLPFTGTDGGTTITDRNIGGSSHTWTAAGNANTDDAQSKFGPTSLACDGTGDYVSTADHADFTLGTSDFTIDCWFNCTATTGSAERIAGQVSAGFASAANDAWGLYRDTTDKIHFALSNGSTFASIDSTTTFTDAVNAGWHHVAVVRTGNTLKMFIDGAQEGADVSFSGTVPNCAAALGVGSLGGYTGEPWTGWIDEFRLSVGIARWTDDFAAPSKPYAPRELGSGFSNDRWQTALYGDRLFFVNGSDTPQVYNGSTVANIAWAGSGLTNTNLITVALVRNRLWFAENNKADVWYGGIGQIAAGSDLTKFQLSQIAGGGVCQAIGSWSRDAGDGSDDFTVFAMSTGEIIVYQGDPATTFALVGKYQGAPPIGRQCMFKVGGELVIITRLGLLPVSACIAMPAGQALDLSAIDPWGKVAPGVVTDATTAASNGGWNGTTHLGAVYINVPLSGTVAKQYVLNTRTASWTNYTNWNASGFASFNNDLYFSAKTGGEVFKVTGSNDDGDAIATLASCAFTFPNNSQKTNVFKAARPRFEIDGDATGLISVDTDFVIGPLIGETVAFSAAGASSGSAWDTSDWETTDWGATAGGSSASRWYSVRGVGKAVSVRLSFTATSGDANWYATDILFKPGGIR